MENKRLEYVDFARGMGVLLMVMGHVGFGGKFSLFIHAFHMPVFFLFSGMFYREMPLRERFRRRFDTLLRPYIIWGGIAFAIWYVLHGFFGYDAGSSAISRLKHLAVTNTTGLPVAGALWFLTALFCCEMISAALLKMMKNKPYPWTMGTAALCLILGALMGGFLKGRTPWGIAQGMVSVFFYCLGYFANSRKLVQKHIPLVWISLAMLAWAVLIFLNGDVNLRTSVYGFLPLFVLNAVLGGYFLLYIGREIEERPRLQASGIWKYITGVGVNSMTYVVTNQIVLLFWKRLSEWIPGGGRLIRFQPVLLVLTLATIFAIDRLIKGKSRRILFGRS